MSVVLLLDGIDCMSSAYDDPRQVVVLLKSEVSLCTHDVLPYHHHHHPSISLTPPMSPMLEQLICQL